MQAKYSVIRETGTHVLIEDLDETGCRSVTNDADRVIADLNSTLDGGIGSRKVVYLDSDKRWDFLEHHQGRFTGFAPANQSQQQFFDLMRQNIE